MFTKEKLGRRVEELRLSKGLDRAGLAGAAGVGVATIREIEIGQSYPTIPTLDKIAKALGVTGAYLADLAR